MTKQYPPIRTFEEKNFEKPKPQNPICSCPELERIIEPVTRKCSRCYGFFDGEIEIKGRKTKYGKSKSK